MPRGFHLLMAAQFASALADNALLIVAIAVLHAQGLPPWWAPLLKFALVSCYVLLAPLLGPLGDAVPKGRLMAWMNGVKIAGLLAMAAGAHPVAAFAVVGFGAAAYAPAKYGLVTELVAPARLVAANGWIEVTVVCAVLLGTVLGGALVTEVLRAGDASAGMRELAAEIGLDAGGDLTLSIAAVLVVYALASLLNLGVPDSGARYPRSPVHPVALLRDFARANRTLWRDRDGGFSLAVTSFLWGAGATLQFAVLRWAIDVHGLGLDRASYLQGLVALGVIAGAGLAGRSFGLGDARRLLPIGIGLGLLVPAVASTGSLLLAMPLLAVIGALAGALVVPMNALLQHRGHRVLSAGRSIAVQGFNENLSVLAMLAVYAALLGAGVPIVTLMWGFGLLITSALGALWWWQRAAPAADASPPAAPIPPA
jgi:MFS family permease